MKYLFLFFCLILCSCEHSALDGKGVCVPTQLHGPSFSSQEGIDSVVIGDGWWFSDVIREGCEIKPEKIECSWFSIIKKDSSIFATVKQNDTGRERLEQVDMDRKNDCGWFTISQCPEPDIELSKDELLFDSEGGIDSVIVTTNRKSWLNDPYISVNYENASYVFRPHKHGSDFSNFWSDTNFWFNINMIDDRKIIFSVNKNESGKERNFSVDIDSRCEANIKIIQSAE